MESGLYDFIVVGAGIAGLAALRQIVAAGRSVLAIEADSKAGGRIKQKTMGRTEVDLGAHWVHSFTQSNAFLQELKQNSIGIRVPTQKVIAIKEGGQVFSQSDFRQGFDLQLKFIQLAQSIALSHLSVQSAATPVLQHAKTQLSQQAGLIFSMFLKENEITEGSRLSRVSSAWNKHFQQDHDAIMQGGYTSYIKKIAEGLPILFNTSVDTIDLTSTPVSLKAGSRTFFAHRVILAVPLIFLKKELIRVFPLPQKITKSIGKLGWGMLNKVLMRFSERFWGQFDLIYLPKGQLQFFRFSDCSSAQDSILACEIAQTEVQRFKNIQDQAVIQMCLSHLRCFFKFQAQLLEASYIRWESEPFAQGAYSFYQVGSSYQDTQLLLQDIAGRLWLAGQYLFKENMGCAHGAWQVGKRQARRALNFSN